jgi:hypothetical protein
LLAQKAVEQRFHVNRQILDFLTVITPRDERRNGDEQTHQCGVERDGNAGGQFGVICKAALAEFAEEANQAVDCANEAEQRADADDDFQDDQAAFEFDDFLARACFEKIDRFVLRLSEMIVRKQGQAR